MLSPVGELAGHADFLAIARASLAAYPEFVRRTAELAGCAIEFRASGKFEVAFRTSGMERLQHLLDFPGVRAVGVTEACTLEPAISPAIAAAIHFPDDALVDNRALRAALEQAARLCGAQVRLDPVRALHVRAGRVTGLQCASGIIAAHHVVITAGAWSGQIEGLPRALPVAPVRGQMIALYGELPLRAMLQSEGCYLIPRAGGRVLVGATVERVGFDARTTEQGRAALHQAAIELVPALDRAELREHWMGFRPGTPDDLPIMGHDPSVEGLLYATGHFRNGILLAPITGTLMADLVEGRAPAFALTSFRPDRFA
jgi:glycine oxidase